MPQWQAKATAILGAGLALGLFCESPPPATSARAELVTALGSCRPLEGRITGLAHASFPEDSADGLQVVTRLDLRLRRMNGGTKSATLSAKALLQIVVHNWAAAASLLRKAGAEAALRNAGADRAQLESDLAAVEVAQASHDDDPYELTSALAAANRAIRLDPHLPEAFFNLALAEERLFLIGHSAADWKRYLELDHGSPWAKEAKRHIARLARLATSDWSSERQRLDAAALSGDFRTLARLVSRFRQRTRLYAEEELLAEWARSAERDDQSHAEAALCRLSAIARALREQTGDGLLDEAVSLLRQSAPSRRQALIAGHLAYARARELITADRFTDAERSLRAARQSLVGAGSPFALWVTFQQTALAYREKRQDEALRMARDLAAVAISHSYAALAGRADGIVGLILMERTEASAAIEVLQTALARFAGNGEMSYRGSILSQLATAYEYLGQPREAWKFRLQALRAIVLSGDSDRGLVLFGTAAQALAREGMPELGLLYEDEVLARELASGQPLGIAEAYWIRGMIHHQAGAEQQAAADLEDAARYCSRIAATATRKHTEAVIASTQGAVERQHDPAAAVQTLSRSLREFQEEKFSFLTVEVLLDRALAFQALGDLARAEADLDAGIAEYEHQRRHMHGVVSRVSFFDRAEQIFDVMIRFQLARQRPDRAFAYAERAKARALLDSVAATPECSSADRACEQEKPRDAASVLATLPPSMALVELHVMEERTLVWLLCRGRLSFLSLDLDATSAAALAARLSSAARNGHDVPAFQTASAELYERLIAPLLGKLPPDVSLIFVTDKELQDVPLAALLNRRTGRFLIQDHPIVVAASASTYGLALARLSAPAHSDTPFTALAIGNPEPDRARFPELKPLPEAAREAERIAALYPGSVMLRGAEATIARFLAELDRHELVQFAGHAVSRMAREASLIFAKPGSANGTGELEATIIAGLHLRRPRLAILSACGSASGPAARLEGTSSLARAFLAAGVPAVLANLWTVDDDVARAFSDRFHASFERRHDPLAALQSAQAAMLASPDARLHAPAAWAGFQLFGAAVSPAPPRSPP